MLSRAALRLINLFAVRPGKRAVASTANDEGYETALECLRHHIEIAAVVDVRTEPSTLPQATELRAAGVTIYPGMKVLEALGSRAVSGARVGSANGKPHGDAGDQRTLECDLILVSTAWQGNGALLFQSGCQLALDREIGQPVPVRLAPGVFAAGEVLGLRLLADTIRSGQVAAQGAVAYLEHETSTWQKELDELLSKARQQSQTSPIASSQE